MSLRDKVKEYTVQTAITPAVKKELEGKSVGEIIHGVLIPAAKQAVQQGRQGRRGFARQLLKEMGKEIRGKHREHKSFEDIVKDYIETDGFMELWDILGFTEDDLRSKITEVLR